jgi:hypothetical protein
MMFHSHFLLKNQQVILGNPEDGMAEWTKSDDDDAG